MSRVRWLGRKGRIRSDYASKEEFAAVFASERAGLQRLALLLTGDSESAKRCLIRTFRECTASSSVSREWVLRWTRRLVIRNAISFVMGPGCPPHVDASDGRESGSFEFSPDDSLSTSGESETIFDLPELDRFVFVICVLEGYSVHDCALLIGRPPRDISEARLRVGNHGGHIDELSDSLQRFAIR